MNAAQVNATKARLGRLRGFLEQDPENRSLREEVFDLALVTGELEAAECEVVHALERDPRDAAWLHRRASLLLARKRYEEAQHVLEELLARGESAPAIIHDLAFALFSRGKREDAARTVQPLLALMDDTGACAWALWLRCQHHLRAHPSALEEFQRRLRLGPVSSEVLGVASLLACDAGLMREADQWSRTALGDRDDQMEALATRGMLAHLAKDGAGALAWFQRALRVNPTDGRAWSGVAFAKMLLQDLAGADEAFAEAVKTMPDHVGTWIGWGWCDLAQGRAEQATKAFERALDIDRNFGESHGSLAVALARLGRTEDARREIELAGRLDSKGLAARYAEAVLAGKSEDPNALGILVRLASWQVRDRLGGK